MLKESSTKKKRKHCNLTKLHDAEAGALLCSPKGNLDMQHQTNIRMFLLGESTTESKVSGQACQKEDSNRVEGRGGKVDDATITWTHSIQSTHHGCQSGW